MPMRRSGRRAMLVSRRRSRGFKRYRSLYDPTPFKLTTTFRAWWPGIIEPSVTPGVTVPIPNMSFFCLPLGQEDATTENAAENYSSAIFGPMIAQRIINDNNITKSLFAVYNLFCLKGIAVRATCSRGVNPNFMPVSQNVVLCLYWGKTDVNQLPNAVGTQSLYEVMLDQDRCFSFQISCLANRPASRYYRAEYDSMGLGGKTYDSVTKFTSLPFAVQLTSQGAMTGFSTHSPIVDINFDFYVTFKDKNG